MGEEFAQTSTPLAILRGILNNYPYSVGLFREILQNSDDAGASKQIFVLDRRTHSTTSLYHDKLGVTQGPALLAYNDANFDANDWIALQSAYESSKAEDSSKIGKYGVGFRSLFHITDCPQIVSGNTFAMFDPLKAFTDSAGKKLDLQATLRSSPGQLTSFSGVVDLAQHQGGFNGTIIRCPLRRESSRISARIIATQDIAHLFSKFISDEIDISLLFLKHIQHVEIREIDEVGTTVTLARLSMSRSAPVVYEVNIATVLETTVKLQASGNAKELVWKVLNCPFDREEAIKRLEKLSSGIITRTLKEHKLLPTIGVAIPISAAAKEFKSGRLFTFLPLPLLTGFPVHIHAYFALTQSRQNLRNSSEIGLVPGSDDSILIQWNKLLFTHYIPQAWRILLEVLVTCGQPPSIFNAWPPEQRYSVTSGENVYWQLLPSTVLDFAKASQSAIWPVYQADAEAKPIFDSLDHVIIADPTQISKDVLQALAAVGLRFTCPPRYIVELIKKDKQIPILSPEQAHRGLLNHSAQLENALKADIDIILGYLLSTNDARYIVGLPLIRLLNDKLVALSLKEKTVKKFTLLTRDEFNVFGACDDDAIALHLLPYRASETIKSQGPKILNVDTLSVSRIVEYLTSYPNKLGLDLSLVRTDPAAVKWLSVFWTWQNTFAQKKELFPKITNLFVLPSTNGLRKADGPLFQIRGAPAASVNALQSLGVPFLDEGVESTAQSILLSLKLLRPISDIHAVLDSLPPSLDDSVTLSEDTCVALLTHLASHISGSCSLSGQLGPERVRRLKSLPIYPVAEFPTHSSTVVITHKALPEGNTIRAIANPAFVPNIPGTVFVQSSTQVLKIVEHLQSSAAQLSDVNLLSLTVDNFLKQSGHVHAAALQSIVNLRQHIPPRVLEVLQKTSFVAVQDGSRKQPNQVVDPGSDVARLYTGSPDQMPRDSSPSDRIVIASLQPLKLMRHTLTIEIIQERIAKIALEPTSDSSKSLANYLLTLMSKAHLDYSGLSIPSRQQWLPTPEGLRSSSQCRDTVQSSRHLFDKVLAILDSSHNLPSSLRAALGWDQPLAVEVLIEQLNRVLASSEDTFTAVLEILKELGRRHTYCTEDLVESLRRITGNRKWVPTSDGHLSDISSAIFSRPNPDSGFYQICPIDQNTGDLLRRIGCTEKPTTTAILSKLQLLSKSSILSLSTTTTALNLLRSLPSYLTDEDRSQLLIPDTQNNLRPFSKTLFNDIGNQASLVPSDNDFICHPLLEESLAQKLPLGRLGLKYAGLGVPEIEMGEKLVITVRKTLTQYTDKQFVTEFLANAADANATEFSLIVSDAPAPTTVSLRALSTEMAKFCTSPSIVVHNNAMFSEGDFIGICRTSVGGKSGKRDTIGQFGLGALTMFHFTELAIIISNDRVLFLNPSKAHLPLHDQAVLFLPLNHVREYYPSHLVQINGLFGFEINSFEPYNGTIFLLPLRQERHCEGSVDFISHTFWTAEKTKTHILDFLRESASNSLIFTKLCRISGSALNSTGHQTLSWAYDAERTDLMPEVDNGYSLTQVCITNRSGSTATWLVANVTVPESQTPADLVSLLNERRLRFPPVAGLAIFFDESAQKGMVFKFFSALPLGITNSLPLHVNASFILASDRRQIRLDDYDGAETRYNKWLLSDIIPSLYYFLLGSALQSGDTDNKQWWPRDVNNDDSYSRIIVESFFTPRLKSCGRKLFRSHYMPTNKISTEDVVLTSGNEPSGISDALNALEPSRLASVLRGVYRLATGHAELSTVTQAFLWQEIYRDPTAITRLGLKGLEGVFHFLSKREENERPIHLYGLQILPLDDDSFGHIIDPESDPNGVQYFVWTPQTPRHHNFSPNRFIHHRFKIPELTKMGINVTTLHRNYQAMQELIDERLNASSPFETLSSEICNWIGEFWATWDEYAFLQLQPEHISAFPLVPTTRLNIYVSLEQCRDGTALIVGGSTEADNLLRAALHELGLAVVRPDEEPTPRALCEIFRDNRNEYPALTFERLLPALSPLVLQEFNSLETELQEAFANWARRNMGHSIPDHLIDLANKLPIWPSLKKGSVRKLRAAESISMLPDGLDLESTGRFMGELVAGYNRQLGALVTVTMTPEQVGNELQLPTTMDESELRDYKTFLCRWLPHLSDNRVISLPNTNRTVAQSDQLYARDPFFIAAFGENSDRFVARELNEIEPILHRHQLRCKDQLDAPMFRVCAEALNDYDDENMVARATILYEAYCIELPMYIPLDEKEAWRDLDELRFIPRSLANERRLDDQDDNAGGINIPSNITALPQVVSPLNLVRKQFEAVAWTQRAFFDVQPHHRVLLAYPGLGQPDVSDVVQHLQALSNMYYSNVHQRHIILHDLEETYTFISKNITIVNEEDRTQLVNGELFLNVDDPDTDEWIWDDCAHLVFETHDTEGSFRHVRKFLQPFSPLLRHLGVLEVHHPQYTAEHSTASDVSKLETIRTGFDRLRKGNHLMDIIFIIDDEDEDKEIPDLPPLVAHRAFLAVLSEFFWSSFCGGFVESRAASPQDPVKMKVPGHSRECVQSILDYIYTGIQSLDNAPLDTLLQILKLSGYWRVSSLFEDMQRQIVVRKMISPSTLESIKEAARDSIAEDLTRACEEYEDKNAAFISKVRQSLAGDGSVQDEEGSE